MKHFSRALVWLTASEVIFNLASYVVHAVVGRLLGPADYGRYGLVITLTTMIIVLIGNGLPTAMSKYLAEVSEAAPWKVPIIKRRAALLQTLLMGSVTVAFFFAAPLIARLLGDPSLAPLFALSALIIPSFAAASFYLHYWNGLHFFRFQAVLKVIRSFARLGIIVSLAAYFGLPGAVSGYILAPLTVFFTAFVADIIISRRQFDGTAPEPFIFSGKELLAYAWPLTLFLVFYEFVLTFDLYLVKALLKDDHLTGLYNAAITVGRIPYFLFYSLAVLLLPAIAKTTAERGTEETTALVGKSMRLMILLLFPLVALLSSYAPEILHLFYGAKYAGAEATLAIFSVGAGFLTVFYVLAFALNGAGKVRIPMILSGIGVAAAIVLNFLLIPRFGIAGAAAATTIISFFLMVGISRYTIAHFGTHLPQRLLGASLISIVIIVLLSRLLPAGPVTFIVSGGALLLLHFGILRLFGALTNDDLSVLRLKRQA